MHKTFLILLAMLMLFTSAVAAQDSEDLPLIAVVHSGPGPVTFGVLSGMFDALIANDVIQHERYAELLSQAGGVHGDDTFVGGNIRVYIADAGHDPLAIPIAVDSALDRMPAALVTIKELPTLNALHEVSQMEAPPVVFFAAMADPWSAGIAKASCIKPDYISGSHTIMPVEEMLPVFMLHNADLTDIGVLHFTGESSSAFGAEEIVKAAEKLGWTARSTGVTGFQDVALAVEGLIAKDAQAIVLPASGFIQSAMPLIASIAKDNGVPLYALGAEAAIFGATIGIGYSYWYDDGARIGQIMAAWLAGEIDIAETAIATQSAYPALGLDLGWQEVEGLAFSQELLDAADILSKDTQPRPTSPWAMQEFGRLYAGRGAVIQELREGSAALLESLRCTPETVAEQEAELAG